MSDDIAIKVENLTKTYKLYDSPQDRLKEALHPLRKKYHHDFHALNGVSFEVKKGETVGIIGRNGSGKSTLLKLINGVIMPTSGEVTVHGKISALLELGAGFNPLISGLENVYFNGTLLGFTKEEIDAKIDNILAFADIGDFIHQPVRSYSSGMFVRLAFAVAVHVDPEILIVDEALSVGDAIIQKKCMDKMHDFQQQGRTILLVSHSLESVKSFADRGIVLDKSRIHFDGSSEDAVTEYLKILFPSRQATVLNALTSSIDNSKTIDKIRELPDIVLVPTDKDLDHSYGAGGGEICRVQVFNSGKGNIFNGGEEMRFRLNYQWNSAVIQALASEHELSSNLIFGMSFEHMTGTTVCEFCTPFIDSQELRVDPSVETYCAIEFKIILPELAAGEYFITIGISLGELSKHIPIRRYRNFIRLKCIPKRSNVFGIMTFPLEINRIYGENNVTSNINM